MEVVVVVLGSEAVVLGVMLTHEVVEELVELLVTDLGAGVCRGVVCVAVEVDAFCRRVSGVG